MKKLAKTMAIVLALGAMMQTLYAFAQEHGYFSVEMEETKIMQLIEMKQHMDQHGESFVDTYEFKNDFPEIQSEEDFKEAFANHALRYIMAIDGKEAFERAIKKPEFKDLRTSRGEPGI